MMREEDSVTDEQKRIVDELEGKGLTVRAIAEKAGVNPQNVYDYQSKKRKNAGKSQAAGEPQAAENAAEKSRKELGRVMAERYTVGWMCPYCRMVWNPYISTCCCQRKE